MNPHETLTAQYLGGTKEVANLLNCAPQQIYSLRKRDDFPDPVWRLAATPLWDLRDIDKFAQTWHRRPRHAQP